MLQNLCTMMAGGLCSCCCMMNGMMVCCYNLMMAHVQVRADRRRRLRHLHQRRPVLLRDDRGVLRVHDLDDEVPAAPAA